MLIDVVIPIERYDALLENCDTLSPEYPLLQNGVITQNEHGKAVRYLCELEQVERLLDFSRQFTADAAPSILESMYLRRRI
jgi:hypothetical protein